MNDETSASETEPNVSRETLGSVFGADERIETACSYVELLATDGIERGLLGPRELPRLWERHVLNSAVIADGIGAEAHVVDVGSGAGLPGIPLAIARPDIFVTLVEPMERRTIFLLETVQSLGLRNVEVVRARADEVDKKGAFDVAVSRAVAPLGKLARWCLPLLKRGGTMMALKGRSAPEEIERDRYIISKAKGSKPVIEYYGSESVVEMPTTVVSIRKK
ncbi:16S rRNA (guanine(527)-N(7))-methyltransferase RsmG [Haloglycomyces albus]|uniref:16S rRNA (guanine(527)-N(7))-methyltransferase RsmG n=1 Tax=Haloglycomyces albus TaxID=526067 RepID=UPI00046D89DB|nr:16S rRNA (guanine(527)-N(7))-methyltransferase RsmG [Haloglycomyces albus]